MRVSLQPPADPVSFGAVIDEAFFEPRVLQCLLGGDAALGVINEDLLQKIQELAVERGVDGNEFLCQSAVVS